MTDATYCRSCGTKVRQDTHAIARRALVGIVGFIVVATAAALIYFFSSGNISNTNTGTPIAITNSFSLSPVSTKPTLTEIKASVVNIFCPDSETLSFDVEGYGGSGTLISTDGIILTASHIFPQDEEYLYIPEEGCIVTLPDPDTGFPDEMYVAQPTVIPGLSDDYDLAYMEIYDAYIDEDGVSYGRYPRVFPAFDDTLLCEEEYVELGESVRVLGYPITSGGETLTITEGVVSSFPGDGTILTSAKIDEGNSGGLAIDHNGCGLGVPSAVSIGEYENLGVIISADLVAEFDEGVYELGEGI
ncbi:serine protease [Patescibacteria group bacterium]